MERFKHCVTFETLLHYSANKIAQVRQAHEYECFLPSIFFFFNIGPEKEIWTKLNLMNMIFYVKTIQIGLFCKSFPNASTDNKNLVKLKNEYKIKDSEEL